MVPSRKKVEATIVAMRNLNEADKGRGRGPEAEQAIGRDRHDLEENEEIEEIAGHHHALDAHHDHQIKQHDRVFLAHEVECAEKADEIDTGGGEGLGEAHAQIDRVWRRRSSGQDLDRFSAVVQPDENQARR